MDETPCQKRDVENIRPVGFLIERQKIEQRRCHSRFLHYHVRRTVPTEPLPRANAISACGPFGDGQHAKEPRSAECETSRYCLLCLPSPDLFKGIAVPILSCVAQESRGAPAEASNRVRKPVDSLWASRTGECPCRATRSRISRDHAGCCHGRRPRPAELLLDAPSRVRSSVKSTSATREQVLLVQL